MNRSADAQKRIDHLNAGGSRTDRIPVDLPLGGRLQMVTDKGEQTFILEGIRLGPGYIHVAGEDDERLNGAWRGMQFYLQPIDPIDDEAYRLAGKARWSNSFVAFWLGAID